MCVRGGHRISPGNGDLKLWIHPETRWQPEPSAHAHVEVCVTNYCTPPHPRWTTRRKAAYRRRLAAARFSAMCIPRTPKHDSSMTAGSAIQAEFYQRSGGHHWKNSIADVDRSCPPEAHGASRHWRSYMQAAQIDYCDELYAAARSG